jgi:hypothetical protein
LRLARFPVGAMPALPSATAVRRAGLAAAVGAGMALVGVSVSGIAGMDDTLRAATERPALHDRSVSYVSRRAGDCRRPDRPRSERAAPADLPTT